MNLYSLIETINNIGDTLMNRTLSVPEWHQLAQTGSAPMMHILLHGSSMEPLIRIRKDYVTIAQTEVSPLIGDIVLFSDPNQEGRYVVHRVWKKKDNSVLTWGDNCPAPDGWIPLDHVWGKVILIERGESRIKPHPKTGLIWAWIWHHVMKIYRLRERMRSKQYKGQ